MNIDNPIVDYENLVFGNLAVQGTEQVNRPYTRRLNYSIIGFSSLSIILCSTFLFNYLQNYNTSSIHNAPVSLYLLGAAASFLSSCLHIRKNSLEKLVVGGE